MKKKKSQLQITIIGLGQIGASVGMALSPQGKRLHRVGYDADMAVAKVAQRDDAVDEVKFRLEAAVRDADILLFALPFHEMRRMMEAAAPLLQKPALILDTAPVKRVTRGWVEELFPQRYAYVGLMPAINSSYLYEAEAGRGARSDLFEDSVIFLSLSPDTSSDVVQFVAGFVQSLGARPVFSNDDEVDGLMASVHILPQLTAAALIHATLGQPGWRDSRKLAGKAYTEATAPLLHQDILPALRDETMTNRENVLRAVDAMIASLHNLRDEIAKEEGDAFLARLGDAIDRRESWWGERLEGRWGAPETPASMPEMPRLFERLFGISPRKNIGDK